MLGDSGANALGALLGLRLASIPGRAPGAACSRAAWRSPSPARRSASPRSSRPRRDCANWTASAAGRRDRRRAAQGVAGARR